MRSAPARRSRAVYIPRELERDIAAGKRPQIVIFYNKQFFTPGNIASSALRRGGLGGDRRPAGAGWPPGAMRRGRWSSSSMC